MSLRQQIVDADNHYYEPDDAWTRHLEPAFRDRAIHVVRGDDGVGRPYFGREPLYYLERTPLDLIGRPGAVVANKDGRYAPLPEEDLIRPGEVPWFVNREARLGWMDGQGIEAVLLWSSLGLAVEHQMRSDPPACAANLRAFNRWLDDDWGFAHQGRGAARGRHRRGFRHRPRMRAEARAGGGAGRRCRYRWRRCCPGGGRIRRSRRAVRSGHHGRGGRQRAHR